MPRLRLGIRSRLLLAVVVAVALALAAITTVFNVLLAQRLSANASALARSRAEAQLSALRVVGGRVRLGEASDAGVADTNIWVFSGNELVEGPRAPAAAVARAVAELVGAGERFADLRSPRLRLAAVPVRDGAARTGTVVAGVALAPYDETRETALVASLVLAAAALAVVAAAAYWILGRALGPVARMTADAEVWSARDLDRRFGLGPPRDELTQLAATLDSLLDRLAASLRHEQRLTAELSHELRTPLARIAAETELGLRRERSDAEYRETLATIARSSEQMTRTIDALMAAAREEAAGTKQSVDVSEVVRAVADQWESQAARIDVGPSAAPVRAAISADLLERVLHPLLENAARHARSRVVVSLGGDDERVVVTVADDGDGVPASEQTSIFEPGFRGATARREAGAGLGLPLARRLARAAGGDVELADGNDGAAFAVILRRVSF